MKKLIGLFAAFALLATAVTGLNSVQTSAVTGKAAEDTAKCKVTVIGKYPSIDKSDSAFKTTGDNVTVQFKVEGDKDCNKEVTFVTWNAPNGTDAKPYTSQTLHDKKTAVFKPGTYSMSVKKPQCFYQIDFVRGSSHLGQTGEPWRYNYNGIDLMIGYVIGGDKSCENVKACNPTTGQIITVSKTDEGKYKPVGDEACKPKTPEKVNVCNPETGEIIEVDKKDAGNYKPVDDTACVETPVTPETPETPEVLPSTGPASALMSMLGVGSIAGSGYYYLQSRRKLNR